MKEPGFPVPDKGGKKERNIRRAVRAGKREGDQAMEGVIVLSALPIEHSTNTFNPTAYAESAKEVYMGLGRKLLEKGIKLENFSARAWESANSILGKINKLSREYQIESRAEKKEKISAQMQKLGTSLGGRITGEIEREIESLPPKNRFSQEETESIIKEALNRIPQATSPAAESPTPDALPEAELQRVETPESKAIPVGLKEIYGHDKIPDSVLEMYGKLKGRDKRESYLTRLRTDYEGRKKKSEHKTRTERPTETDPDVDTSGIGTLGNARVNMQREMNKIVFDAESASKPLAQEIQPSIRDNNNPWGEYTEEQLEGSVASDPSTVQKAQLEQDTLDSEAAQTAAELEIAYTNSPAGSTERKADLTNRQKEVIARFREKQRIDAIQNATAPKIVGFSNESAETDSQTTPGAESTHKEVHSKFLSVMKRAGEVFGWYSSSEDKLIRRSAELDAEAEKIGGTEKFFRSMGEHYNKMGWKSKLVLGASLGIGAGISAATVSLPAIIGFTLGITAQRTAGLMTMYMKFEKDSIEKGKWGKWGKERAFGKAFVYTAAMTGVMMGVTEGVKQLSESEWGQRLREWVGDKLGHHSVHAADASEPGSRAHTPYETLKMQRAAHVANVKMWTDLHPDQPFPGDEAARTEFSRAQAEELAAAVPKQEHVPPTAETPVAAEPRTTGFQTEPRHMDNAFAKPSSLEVPSMSKLTEAQLRHAGEGPTLTEAQLRHAGEGPALTEAQLRHAGEGLSSSAPETPLASVEAIIGKGYISMIKELLKNPDVKAHDFPEGSDMHRILEAKTPADINKVLDDIAKDNKFLNQNGTSVRIDLHSHMTIGSDGQLLLNGAHQAPEGARVTPEYHPNAPTTPQPQVASEVAPDTHTPVAPEVAVEKAPPQTIAPAPEVKAPTQAPEAQPLASRPIAAERPLGTVDLTHAQELAEQQRDFVAQRLAEASTVQHEVQPLVHETVPAHGLVQGVDLTSESHGDAEQRIIQENLLNTPTETSVPVPVEGLAPEAAIVPIGQGEIISNQFGTKIAVAEPHIYGDSKAERLFVYGGTPQERAQAMLKYLVENPNKVVFGTDDSSTYRIAWRLVDGELVPSVPMRTNGLFGFFSDWMKAPGPDDLEKLIK